MAPGGDGEGGMELEPPLQPVAGAAAPDAPAEEAGARGAATPALLLPAAAAEAVEAPPGAKRAAMSLAAAAVSGCASVTASNLPAWMKPVAGRGDMLMTTHT